MPTDRAEWDRLTINGRPGGLVHVLTALEIAAEKCGIIKPGRPVVMSLQEATAAEVVVRGAGQ